MSDEARAYVKQFSPFRNSTFWVHYALADIANAQHDYELWVSDERLMDEWPLSRSSIHSAYTELVRQGFLTILERGASHRRTRYRFEFLETAEVRPASNSSKSRTKPAQSTSEVWTNSSESRIPHLLLQQKETEPPRAEIQQAICGACGIWADRLTPSARASLDRSIRELISVGATAEGIESTAKAFKAKWPDALITPAALAKWYGTIPTAKAPRAAFTALRGQTCGRCEGTGWERPEEVGRQPVTRCADCGGSGLAPDPEAA